MHLAMPFRTSSLARILPTAAILMVAAAPAAATPGANLEIFAGGALDQSGNEWTFPDGETISSCCSDQAFSISNVSTAGEQITGITIDLDDTSLYPDILWDPAEFPDDDGPVGDSAGIDYAVGADPAGGSIAAHTGLKKRQGGYGAWQITPTGFDPGENAKFGIDIDPSSIKNSPPSATGGHIAGLELHGAAVTVSFSDGSVLTGDIIGFPGEFGGAGAKAVIAPGLPAAPGIGRAGGASSPATVSSADQSIVVTGDPGAAGKLYVGEGNLSVEVQPQGGFDLDPFEANKAKRIEIIDFTIGAGGTATVPVTLERAGDGDAEPDSIGLHYITAYIDNGSGSGRVSDPVILRFDPSADNDAPALVSRAPGPGATGADVSAPVTVVFDEAMDPGTLSSGGFRLIGPGNQPVQASVIASADRRTFSLVPAGPLEGTSAYQVVLGSAVADLAGNALSGTDITWSFTTGVGVVTGDKPVPVGAVCAPVDPPAASSSPSTKVTASVTQLRINQRISSAAVRRANAIQAWLDAGIVSDDLCGQSLVPRDFGPGVVLGAGAQSTGGAADPRPLMVAAPGKPGKVRRTVGQLRINQRISSAALRRINALTTRMTELTGGDVVDGAVTAGKLNGTSSIVSASTTGTAATASTTRVAPPKGGNATFTLTPRQLRINQKISQAAVRRVNALTARIAAGLTSANFADGSITAIDLDPGLRS